MPRVDRGAPIVTCSGPGWGLVVNHNGDAGGGGRGPWHYFRADGRSLCGHFNLNTCRLVHSIQQGADSSSLNCNACRRLKEAADWVDRGEHLIRLPEPPEEEE